MYCMTGRGHLACQDVPRRILSGREIPVNWGVSMRGKVYDPHSGFALCEDSVGVPVNRERRSGTLMVSQAR